MDVVPWFLITIVALWTCKRAYGYVRLRQAVRSNGCSPPRRYPHKDPVLGLDLFYDQFKSMKRGETAKNERQRFHKYGKTFEANSWGTTCIHTMEPDNLQVVLAQCFDNFGVEPMRLHIGRPFIGKGVFSTDGAYWQYSRNLIKPIFARAQVSDLNTLGCHLEHMMDQIPRDGSTVDIQNLLKLTFLDHSTQTIFGESTKTLWTNSPNDHSHELLTTFDAALRGLGKRILLGRLRILFLWDRSYGRLAHKVHVVIDQYIDKALERKGKHASNTTAGNPSQPPNMLDELVNRLDDRQEIRDQLINIFLPARDATAIGLSGVLFLLARHPRVWQKLRAEILPEKDPISFETLKSLQYMRFVLNEGFRLLMPANRNMRLCLKDCILPTGGGPHGTAPIFVTRGTQVSVNFGAMQRDKDIWGDDADEFRPERWENIKPGWHYTPFSGGPRVCPGQQLALTQSAYVLARLLQAFDQIENRDPELA
ncbi:MAG: hypothetical protein Q9218_005613, partial [Villophora microphyllina]